MSRNVYLVAYYKTHGGEVNYSPEWMTGENISYDEIEGRIYLGGSGTSSMLHHISKDINGVFLKEDIAWDDLGGLSCGYHWYGHPDALTQLLLHPDVMSSYRMDWSADFLKKFFANYAPHYVIAVAVA